MINNKSFFDIIIKDKEKLHEKIIEMRRNTDYTTWNLLDYQYFSEHYKLIDIDLSKQKDLDITQI